MTTIYGLQLKEWSRNLIVLKTKSFGLKCEPMFNTERK